LHRPGGLPRAPERADGLPVLAPGRARGRPLARVGGRVRRPAEAGGGRRRPLRAARPEEPLPMTTPLAAYALLFLAVGVGFIFVHLMAGKLIRPNKPDPEKGTIYECGEPTIGSAWVQFDLRFYVVALLFVIFDVEVAFFFPWAEVFGKANALATQKQPTDAPSYQEYAGRGLDGPVPPSTEQQQRGAARYRQMQKLTPEEGGQDKGTLRPGEFEANRRAARDLAWLAFVEILVFFGVLLVGFAYLWRRGDLAWVRSLGERQAGAQAPGGNGVPPAAAAARPLVGAGEQGRVTA